MRFLLCGVDESGPARHAAYVAARFARRSGAELTLLHALEPPKARAGWEAARERAAAARAALADLVDHVAEVLGARPALRIELGRPAERLLVAATEAPDEALIVIGRPRRGRIADLLLGETHRHLVGQDRHPVMVVPAGAHAPAGGHLLAACDLAGDPRATVITAGRIAAAADQALAVLHVQSDPGATGWQLYDGRRRLTQALRAAGLAHLPLSTLERGGEPAEQIVATADELGADAIVLGSDGRRRWRRIPRASTGAQVAGAALRPIVFAPAPGRLRAHGAGVTLRARPVPRRPVGQPGR